VDGSLRDDKFRGEKKGKRGSSRVMHGQDAAVSADDKFGGRKGERGSMDVTT